MKNSGVFFLEFFHLINMGRLLLGVEDPVQIIKENSPTNLIFHCFPRSFAILFSVVLPQLAHTKSKSP